MCSGGLEALVYRVNSYSHRRLGEKFPAAPRRAAEKTRGSFTSFSVKGPHARNVQVKRKLSYRFRLNVCAGLPNAVSSQLSSFWCRSSRVTGTANTE